MFTWQKILVIALMSTFPIVVFTFYVFQRDNREALPKLTADTASPQRTESNFKAIEIAVAAKVKEISSIEVKILAAEGEAIKFKEQRIGEIEELEKLMKIIRPIVEKGRSASSVPRLRH